MKTPEWLYIVFIHDFTEDYGDINASINSNPTFESIVTHFSKLAYSGNIQVVFIKNYFLNLRPLHPISKLTKPLNSTRPLHNKRIIFLKQRKEFRNEKKFSSNKAKNFLYLSKTEIHESAPDETGNFKIVSTKKEFDYWEEGFDFVLNNYKADKYILHTCSHSDGFSINVTDHGFVLNGSGNLLNKKDFQVKQSKMYDNYFQKIIKGRKNKNFLTGFKHAYVPKNKSLKKINPGKLPLKKWAITNNSNGLLIYDFAQYLTRKKIKFSFLFLQNCKTFLFENLYYLNKLAEIIIGPTTNISKELNVAKVFYESIQISASPSVVKNQIIFGLRQLIIEKKNPDYRWLYAETSNIDLIYEKFSALVSKLIFLYNTDETFIRYKENGFTLATATGDLEIYQFYDTVNLLKYLCSSNDILLNEVNKFEKLCNGVFIPLHSYTDNNNYPTILFPLKFRYNYLSHIRSLFRNPYNRFSENSKYSTLITTLFLK